MSGEFPSGDKKSRNGGEKKEICQRENPHRWRKDRDKGEFEWKYTKKNPKSCIIWLDKQYYTLYSIIRSKPKTLTTLII